MMQEEAGNCALVSRFLWPIPTLAVANFYRLVGVSMGILVGHTSWDFSRLQSVQYFDEFWSRTRNIQQTWSCALWLLLTLKFKGNKGTGWEPSETRRTVPQWPRPSRFGVAAAGGPPLTSALPEIVAWRAWNNIGLDPNSKPTRYHTSSCRTFRRWTSISSIAFWCSTGRDSTYPPNWSSTTANHIDRAEANSLLASLDVLFRGKLESQFAVKCQKILVKMRQTPASPGAVHRCTQQMILQKRAAGWWLIHQLQKHVGNRADLPREKKTQGDVEVS